jgi:hypothetical protein
MRTVGVVVLVWAILSIPVAVLTGKYISRFGGETPSPPQRDDDDYPGSRPRCDRRAP